MLSRIATTAAGVALAASACGGEVAAPVYEDAPAIVAALDEVGMGCSDMETITVDPADPDAILPGLMSLVNCVWPTEQRPDLPADFPAALVFASEADRVAGILSVVVHGCAAAPPVQGYLAYVHSESWVFQSGFGTVDLATMEEVAEVLGGEAVAAECGDVPWINSALAARDAGDLAAMKEALGED